MANEIAEHIFILNKSIGIRSAKHTIPYISWQIIEKYWADKIEDNNEDLNAVISSLFDTIKEKLVLSNANRFEKYYDMLTNDQIKQMANEMINAGVDITQLSQYKSNGHYYVLCLSNLLQRCSRFGLNTFLMVVFGTSRMPRFLRERS